MVVERRCGDEWRQLALLRCGLHTRRDKSEVFFGLLAATEEEGQMPGGDGPDEADLKVGGRVGNGLVDAVEATLREIVLGPQAPAAARLEKVKTAFIGFNEGTCRILRAQRFKEMASLRGGGSVSFHSLEVCSPRSDELRIGDRQLRFRAARAWRSE